MKQLKVYKFISYLFDSPWPLELHKFAFRGNITLRSSTIIVRVTFRPNLTFKVRVIFKVKLTFKVRVIFRARLTSNVRLTFKYKISFRGRSNSSVDIALELDWVLFQSHVSYSFNMTSLLTSTLLVSGQ